MNAIVEQPLAIRVMYPESDGRRIAENTKQFEYIVMIKGGLDAEFADDPEVFVAGDLLWYPVEGRRKLRTAPDTMVIFGRPKGHRRSYLQWLEEGIPPKVTFEVLSPGNRAGKMLKKFKFYERFGVDEYYIYDPDDNPQGWGGTVVTTQLAKAFGVEAKGFTLVDTGSAAGLDGSMAKAYEQKGPWLGFYWAPTSMLGKYDMVAVDFGVPNDMAEWKRCTSVADCPDPKQNAFPRDNVFTLVSKKFADETDPAVLDYLKKRSWTNDTVNKLMAWMTDNQATGEDGAREFLKQNPDMWTQWVSPEAAEKIKAAL